MTWSFILIVVTNSRVRVCDIDVVVFRYWYNLIMEIRKDIHFLFRYISCVAVVILCSEHVSEISGTTLQQQATKNALKVRRVLCVMSIDEDEVLTILTDSHLGNWATEVTMRKRILSRLGYRKLQVMREILPKQFAPWKMRLWMPRWTGQLL